MGDLRTDSARRRVVMEDVDGIAAIVSECHLRPEGVSARQIAEEIAQWMKDCLEDDFGHQGEPNAALVAAFRRGVQFRETTNAPVPSDEGVLARLARQDVTAYCANCGTAMCEHVTGDLIRTSQALRMIRDTCPGTAARIARRALGDRPDPDDPPELTADPDGHPGIGRGSGYDGRYDPLG